MSGYIIEEEDISYIVDNKGNEKPLNYWALYSNLQARRNKKVLKQLSDIWWQVEAPLKILHNEGIELNEIMKKIIKLYFGYMRLNKQQENDKKQRIKQEKIQAELQ